MSLRDFLNWFEGFSENLKGAPTKAQWERIRLRLLALKADAGPEIGGMTGPIQIWTDTGGAGTTAWWKGEVKKALMDNDVLSLDPETADDVLRKIPIDLNADPLEVALRAVQATSDDDE